MTECEQRMREIEEAVATLTPAQKDLYQIVVRKLMEIENRVTALEQGYVLNGDI